MRSPPLCSKARSCCLGTPDLPCKRFSTVTIDFPMPGPHRAPSTGMEEKRHSQPAPVDSSAREDAPRRSSLRCLPILAPRATGGGTRRMMRHSRLCYASLPALSGDHVTRLSSSPAWRGSLGLYRSTHFSLFSVRLVPDSWFSVLGSRLLVLGSRPSALGFLSLLSQPAVQGKCLCHLAHLDTDRRKPALIVAVLQSL